MNTTTDWEVIGYISPALPGAKIVEPVLRSLTNPDVYFLADNPENDIRAELEKTPVKDSEGHPLLGGSYFVPCEDAMKWHDRDLYVRNAQGSLLAVAVFADDLVRFEKIKKVLGR